MKVYCAGKTQALHEVKLIAGLVKSTGHTITHPWWEVVEREGGDVTEVEISPEKKQQYALDDVRGVLTADLVIALGHPRISGTLWEVGGAAFARIPVWLVDWEKYGRVSVFEDLPNVEKLDVQEVGERLWKLSTTRAERQPGPIMVNSPEGGVKIALCDECGEYASHKHPMKYAFLCCKHYIEAGNPPTDWHPDCRYYSQAPLNLG